jgi:hypothetical protein
MSVLQRETVKVVNKSIPSGFMFINITDFDEKVHKKWAAPIPRVVKKVVEEFPVEEPKSYTKPTRRTRKPK